MDCNAELTMILGQQIKERFEKVSNIGGINIYLVQDSEGIHWKYKGVECHAQFYENRNNPYNLFYNIKFPRREGLFQKVEASVSGYEIGKSKYFGRPRREFFEDNDIQSYTLLCSIKRKPKNKKEQDDMLGFIWGKLIGPILGKATGIF